MYVKVCVLCQRFLSKNLSGCLFQCNCYLQGSCAFNFVSDVKTFAQTGSNVIGLKLDGSFGVPFLYISTQKPFLQVTGMTFLVQQ